MTASRIPVSTYRVQFNQQFRFVDARGIVPYLDEIGIGDLYSSPRFRAVRGSSHGYDVADPSRVNSELGTEEEFDELCDGLRHYNMGLLLDIVPNHMAASHENPWWMDVLEHGPSSPYAHYFDIDWRPATSKAAFLQEDKILLPVVGDLYGDALENQEFTPRVDEGGFYLRYWERRLPLDPRSYAPILEAGARRLAAKLSEDHPLTRQMTQLRDEAAGIPPYADTRPKEIERRRRIAQALKSRLFSAYRDEPEIRAAIDAVLVDLGGIKGKPGSFDALHKILESQPYRLAHWKIAFEEINYRRFLDINDLVCLRVEDAEVFEARHRHIVQLVRQGKVSGLRVDHIDGLHDPQAYLRRLQDAAASGSARQRAYVVVEKVLGRGEPLPEDWQTSGTTGYDFLNALNDLFVEPEGLRQLETAYARFTGDASPFAETCYARNKQVMWKLFTGEVNALGHHLGHLAAQDRRARDVPLSELMHALVEVTACLPVYRTYIRDFDIPARDRFYLERTLALARRRTTEVQVSSDAFAFLRRVLLLDLPRGSAHQRQEWLRFLLRWQQFTGPVMAKGLEDTAFYAHHSLISRNEVGSDPLRLDPPLDLDGFHDFLQGRLQRWPHSLNATSTHDTKRAEDVRARLNVLSELPREWEQRLRRWSQWNLHKKRLVEGSAVPTPGEEVLLYQTLLGAWPLEPADAPSFLDRVKGFLVKAVREAKTYSGWIRPNEPHESACLHFLEAILDPSPRNLFLADFLRFQKRLACHGALNGLSQVLIKITAPGVPDFYQGAELWNLSLVDPDNRRPVDFRVRREMLEELRKREGENLPALLGELLANWQDGRIKLYLTARALAFRRTHAGLFLDGAYIPVASAGAKRENVISFSRQEGVLWSMTVTPRWTTRLAPAGRPPLGKRVWQDTVLQLPETAPGTWRNVLTGETLPAALAGGRQRVLYLHNVLRRFPVALLKGAAPEERRVS